jgi:uroporphyrinogen-III decarboxylase
MAEFVSVLKSMNPALKVAYHSDGCIYPIVGDLVDIGIDVLNPIQPRAMDPLRLKRDYGDRLCFWGCIDEQYTLPFGTAAEVRSEVLDRICAFDAGGLILSPTHHVQLDTPMENFWSMVDAIRSTPVAAAAM